MKPQAAPLHIGLHKRFVELAESVLSGQGIKELWWMSVHEDALKICKVSGYEYFGYALLSSLYALKGDKPRWEEYYLKSTDISPIETCDFSIFQLHVNSSTMISSPVGVERLKMLAREAVEIEQLLFVNGVCHTLCLFESANIAFHRAEKMKANVTDGPYVWVESDLGWFTERDEKFDENVFFERLLVASKAVFDVTKKIIIATRFVHSGEDGSRFLFLIDAPIDLLVEADWMIAENMVNEFDDTLAEFITFSTSPLEKQHTYDGLL